MLKIKTLDEKRMEVIDLLRNTTERQCTGLLQDPSSGGFCVYGIIGTKLLGMDVGPDCRYIYFYKAVGDYIKIKRHTGELTVDLIYLNDEMQMSFRQIADYLESIWFPRDPSPLSVPTSTE